MCPSFAIDRGSRRRRRLCLVHSNELNWFVRRPGQNKRTLGIRRCLHLQRPVCVSIAANWRLLRGRCCRCRCCCNVHSCQRTNSFGCMWHPRDWGRLLPLPLPLLHSAPIHFRLLQLMQENTVVVVALRRTRTSHLSSVFPSFHLHLVRKFL